MPKPILIIGVPLSENESPERVHEVMEATNDSAFRSGIGQDYHIIVHPTKEEEMQFRVFYDKDFEITGLEDIKEIVRTSLDKFRKQ